MKHSRKSLCRYRDGGDGKLKIPVLFKDSPRITVIILAKFISDEMHTKADQTVRSFKYNDDRKVLH